MMDTAALENRDESANARETRRRTKIDGVDRAIMAALEENPQEPNNRIAIAAGVSEMTVANRIERLVSEKIIKITLQRDIETLGFQKVGLVDVFVKGRSSADVASEISLIEEAVSVTIMAGDPQIVVLVMARDFDDFLSIIQDKIGAVEGVSKAASAMAMKVVKFSTGVAAI